MNNARAPGGRHPPGRSPALQGAGLLPVCISRAFDTSRGATRWLLQIKKAHPPPVLRRGLSRGRHRNTAEVSAARVG